MFFSYFWFYMRIAYKMCLFMVRSMDTGQGVIISNLSNCKSSCCSYFLHFYILLPSAVIWLSQPQVIAMPASLNYCHYCSTHYTRFLIDPVMADSYGDWWLNAFKSCWLPPHTHTHHTHSIHFNQWIWISSLFSRTFIEWNRNHGVCSIWMRNEIFEMNEFKFDFHPMEIRKWLNNDDWLELRYFH